MSLVERQAKLEVFTEALKRLVRRGLTAAAVAANFHWQRVLSLMERRLAIYQLTPQAASEGLQMSRELLSHDVATQRAKSIVAHFPANFTQLWAIKMRPAEGYIQLVNFAFGYRWFCVAPLPLTNLSHARRD